MNDWTDNQTEAHTSLSEALGVVDDVISYMSDAQGKPADRERALFAGAVVFIYGVWESFVEQLAIELAERMSAIVDPKQVPETIKKGLEKRNAWELSVSPGWRALWAEFVKTKAIGDDSDPANKHGMNTLREPQVKYLLSLVGVERPFASFPAASFPPYLTAKNPKLNVGDALNELVTLRGAIVHTGKVPTTLRKGHVRAWRKFVEDAARIVDHACRSECKALLIA